MTWWQVTLLSQYQEDFSSYTLKQFMDDYTKAALPAQRLQLCCERGLGKKRLMCSRGTWRKMSMGSISLSPVTS